MRALTVLLALALTCASSAFAATQKLIALTFDDGPRPYILFGYQPAGGPAIPSLLELLDKNQVKATFFVMGWRLMPKQYGDPHEFRTATTCLDAAREVVKRGHEIENHSYSHVQFKLFEKQHGPDSAVADVDRASALIKNVTGAPPQFVRPPDWIIWPDLEHKLQAHGYRVMTIGSEEPAAWRDINTVDYLCAGAHPKQCPKEGDAQYVLQQIAQREKHGVTTHILTFHELSTTESTLATLIPQLKAQGYRFVTMKDYAREVGAEKPAPSKSAAGK